MDFSEAELTANPHEVLTRLREAGPVHRFDLMPGTDGWLITGYDDARRALTDPRLSKTAMINGRLGGGVFPAEIQRAISLHMLNADPPDHTRLRRLVSAAFTARRMEGLRPRVQEITDALIADLAGRETADIIDDFAFPLPFTVICELIGVPQVDRDNFRAWSNTLVGGATDPEQAFHAITSMTSYVRGLVELKRSEPDDALLSAMIDVTDSGDRLSEDELTSLVFLLLVAGHETTVNLIGNAMFLLLSRPDDAAALRADESLLPAAVEEFLRYESPVKTTTYRMTTEPVTVGDVTIPADAIVIVSLLSANHDSGTFADAEVFDPARVDAQQHIAFGYGIHYCLGAPLARLEGQIAVGSLLRAFPALAPAEPLDELTWRPGILLRGLNHLPVRLS
ncbi:cytochrome P450 [Allocatelliglobosispora scoriae]|uniref:Cytochrome P450 n=1 Tax=Allocatelliglobosispora scoriae TaxID=643052 RepID=A0A841BKS3_9ACTN|nr:cytochrome P450 [Allocatelliglobosispora scoriae]MBB5869697.1 cytochrome P450 [Allocatelliglobosispora scoriae]